MRTIGRGLALLVAVAALAWLGVSWDTLLPRRIDDSGDDRIAGARRALAYALPREGWVTFPIDAAGEKMLRILTNANVTPLEAADPESVVEYAIEYEILDRDGLILDFARHVQRARVSLYEDPRNVGTVQFGVFYLDSDDIPADGRIVLVNFARHSEATQIRLRVADEPTTATGVIARVYQRESPAEYKLANRWGRLSDERREELARGNVYDYQLITREEKLALVRYRWNPVAPFGVGATDFKQIALYIRAEASFEPIREPVIPHGLIVDRDMHGTIPLPRSRDVVSFEFEPIENADALQAEISWRGDESHRHERSLVDIRPPVTRFERHYDEPGLLEITTNGALAVRISGTDADGAGIDLTPRPRYLRSYRVAPDEPVDYDISQALDGSIGLRIDARLLLEPVEDSAELELGIAFHAADEALVTTLACRETVAPSTYDRVDLPPADPRRLSDAATCYVQVPATATRVRLSGDRALLTNAFTRPPHLIKETQVPDDYISFQDESTSPPTWFYLRPRDRAALSRAGRSAQIVLQGRPRDEDEELLAGRYRWDDYQPAGNWTARYVLNPRDSRLPLRDQALASVFRPLTANRAVRVEFRGTPGQRTLAPRMIFTKPDPGAMSATITVDGRRVMRRRLRGTRGEFRLPPLSIGAHEVTLTTDAPASWFVNHIDGPGKTFVRRLAVRLAADVMRFDYRKNLPAEVLTGHLQVPFGASLAARLRVLVTPKRAPAGTVISDWSARDRRYVIRPDNSSAVPVLGGAEAPLDRGRRFFIPLNADLAAGDYDIKIWLENVDNAYLSLYRLTPGQHNRGRLFQEHSVVE